MQEKRERDDNIDGNNNDVRSVGLLSYGWLLTIKIFIRIHMESCIIYGAQLLHLRWQQRHHRRLTL